VSNKNTQPEDTVEVLEPSHEPVVVTIGQDPFQSSYTLQPLSFFQKIEFFSVLGGALNAAMSGPDGLTLSELFEGPSALGDTLENQNWADADTFVKAIAVLLQFAPDLFANMYLVILGVPRSQRALMRGIMEDTEERGGLSDEQGFLILETFIDQNWEVLVDFFKNRVLPLGQKISKKMQPQESQPSTP